MEKIRLGFIGTGEAAKNIHVPAVQALPELFEIVNACSRNEEKCRQFAQMAGAAKWCTDYRELLADPNVDAVVINAPFELNHPFMWASLDAGKHVFVEKPLADSLERAKEMVKWSEETRLVSLFAENYRYRDGVRLIKDAYIDKGVIGKPTIMVYSNYAHIDRNSPWLVNGPWRLNCVGGIVTERFVHYVAAVREIMGSARCAVGYGGKMRDNIGPYDYGTVSIVFESGGTGIIHDVARCQISAGRSIKKLSIGIC
jgi:predicted dehydrogenase